MNATKHDIHYEVSLSNAGGHLFSIELTIEHPAPEGQRLSLPAWIAGSYMIRDFAKNVVTLNASSNNHPIRVTKLDKQQWQCEPCSEPLVIRYDIYAWDLSVRSAHFDTTHAYFNGTSIFLCVVGQENNPCSVELIKPEQGYAQNWSVATTLTSHNAKPYSFGKYSAEDYDDLIDHPVEISDFTLIEFEARGIPHAMALTGQFSCDLERLKHDLIKICEYEIDLFGEAPFKQYLFQVMVVGSGYGGLEHRSSTSLLCSRNDLPKPNDPKVSDEYRQFLTLCSHEYFHSWNIKRIKPSVFIPYDLSQESYSPLLWFFEGVTSYYDELVLARTGIISMESYLEMLAQNITRVISNSGRYKQTLFESSFDAWTKFYKQDENAPNAIVSYYAKGAMAALALDLLLHTTTDKTLDDVMRGLWRDHGKPLIGLTPEGLETYISQISGIDLTDFFNETLRSTNDIELCKPFAAIGVSYKLRAPTSLTDKGGKPSSEAPIPYTGLRYQKAENGAVNVLSVLEDSPAQRSGVSAQDLIVAIDGLKTTSASIDQQVNSLKSGTPATLHCFRRDELMVFELTPESPPQTICYLQIDDSDNPILNRWIGAGH